LINDLLFYKFNSLTYYECKIIYPEIEELISREDHQRVGIDELAEWKMSEPGL